MHMHKELTLDERVTAFTRELEQISERVEIGKRKWDEAVKNNTIEQHKVDVKEELDYLQNAYKELEKRQMELLEEVNNYNPHHERIKQLLRS